MKTRLDRRTLGKAVLAGAAAVPLVSPGRATAAPAAGPVRLTLPPPTGPFPVGVTAIRLIDPRDSGRSLMCGVWYPARDVRHFPRAAWLAPAAVRALLESAGYAADAAVSPTTAGRVGAPVRRLPGRSPVVLYSHGAHDHRADTTIIVQELASHGFVVVTVDHTGDAFSVFPDGRLVVPSEDPDEGLGPADFAGDIRFVLDRVTDIAGGRNPDAERRPLPAGLADALDLRRVGMFGWSKGGTATALAMLADRRVRAGLSLDGPMLPTITAGLDRPFMLMTAELTRALEPSVAEFWSHLAGWRLNIQVAGAQHNAYTDYAVLIPQLTGETERRAARIQQAYPRAFFDLHLRGRDGALLAGPNPAFPEVEFIR